MKFELYYDGHIDFVPLFLEEAAQQIERDYKENKKLPYFRIVNGSYSFNWILNE